MKNVKKEVVNISSQQALELIKSLRYFHIIHIIKEKDINMMTTDLDNRYLKLINNQNCISDFQSAIKDAMQNSFLKFDSAKGISVLNLRRLKKI